MDDEVRDLIDRLALARHPEGGWYRETWRAASAGRERSRSAGTSILFLLEAHQRSHWHRIDATELWIFQAGKALTLSTADAGKVSSVRLGADIRAGDRPQHVVAPSQWQSAQAGDGWSLVACVVVPAFRFETFELAPPGWEPG